MASLKTNKKWARIRDRQQCQICGDIIPIQFGRLEVHHIIYRCNNGTNEIENLITLCDLCHAVIHDHMGPAWVGISKMPKEEQENNRPILKQSKNEFESFLLLPTKERQRIQNELWTQLGIKRSDCQ